jgi:hypothetical protein
MNKPLESRAVPSLITEVIKAEENEQQLKAATKALHTLVDKIIGERSQPIRSQYRNMLSNSSDDPRRVDFNLDQQVTGTERPLKLVLETDGNPYRQNAIEYTIELRGGKKERLVLLPAHAYFVLVPPGMLDEPSFNREASLSEILAYTEIVEFANSNMPATPTES